MGDVKGERKEDHTGRTYIDTSTRTNIFRFRVTVSRSLVRSITLSIYIGGLMTTINRFTTYTRRYKDPLFVYDSFFPTVRFGDRRLVPLLPLHMCI